MNLSDDERAQQAKRRWWNEPNIDDLELGPDVEQFWDLPMHDETWRIRQAALRQARRELVLKKARAKARQRSRRPKVLRVAGMLGGLLLLGLTAGACQLHPDGTWSDVGDPIPPATARDVSPIVVVHGCTDLGGYPFSYAGPAASVPWDQCPGSKTPLLQPKDGTVEVAG